MEMVVSAPVSVGKLQPQQLSVTKFDGGSGKVNQFKLPTDNGVSRWRKPKQPKTVDRQGWLHHEQREVQKNSF